MEDTGRHGDGSFVWPDPPEFPGLADLFHIVFPQSGSGHGSLSPLRDVNCPRGLAGRLIQRGLPQSGSRLRFSPAPARLRIPAESVFETRRTPSGRGSGRRYRLQRLAGYQLLVFRTIRRIRELCASRISAEWFRFSGIFVRPLSFSPV